MTKSAVLLVVVAMVLYVNASPTPTLMDPFEFVRQHMNGFSGMDLSNPSDIESKIMQMSGKGNNGVYMSTSQVAGQPAITHTKIVKDGDMYSATFINNNLVEENGKTVSSTSTQ